MHKLFLSIHSNLPQMRPCIFCGRRRGLQTIFNMTSSTKSQRCFEILSLTTRRQAQRPFFSQGSSFWSMSEHSLTTLNSLWSSAQSKLPKNIYNFSIKYINNTLPTKTNLKRWGLSPSSNCSFCLTQESLLHIVSGCKVYLQQGCYTWHHDSILMLIATTFR